MIENFKGGTAVFTNPSTPIKCGGAPHKIRYLACDYWLKKGILDKCDVHYGADVTAVDGINKTVEFKTKEIDENLNQKLSSENAGCYGIAENSSGEELTKVTLNFDLCHAVPPQSAPDFIKNSPLREAQNPQGYLEVDKNTLQHTCFSNVFALGNCTNAPCSKTGAAIRKQAPVVVENLLPIMDKKTVTAQYDGYSACPIPTQYEKLILAEFDYTNTPKMTFPINQAKPNWAMWIPKTKIPPGLYWNKILKGTA